MRLLRLLAGLLVIALAVGAQDPVATDYYDYYEDPTADVASPQDASATASDQGASAPAKEGEEALADDPVTEPAVTTTTPASTTEGRRKLVSLKSAKIGRSRESRQTTEAPAAAEGSPAATPEAESSAGGRRFGGSTLARSGIQRTRSNSRLSATQPETENAAEASPAAAPTRGRFRPSARSEPAAASTDETQGSSSNRFQPRRSSFRPSSSSSSSSSSDAPAEEASDKPAPSRFRPASRNSFRPSASRSVTESSTPSTEGETDAPHRFGTARRGRGNSRGGSAFQPSRSRTEQSAATAEEVVEGGEEEEAAAAAVASDPSRPSSRRLSGGKFRGPPIIRKTQHIRRPLGIPNTTSAPTTTTSATTTTTISTTTTTATTTETPTTSVLVLQESTTESAAFEEQTESPVKTEDMTNMEDKEDTKGVMDITNMDDMTKIEAMARTDETITMDDMTGLNENTGITNMDEETNMEMMGNKEDMTMLEKRKGVDEVTEKAKILRNDDATSSMDEMPITDEILQDDASVNDHQTEPKPVVFRPIPLRRTTTEAAAETSTEPALARTEPPVTRSSRRGSSRYSPPKPPSHPIVETTQAPAPSSADIFEAPLSDAVKLQSRVNSRARAPSSRESNTNTVSNGPTQFVQQTVDIEEDGTSSRFRRPSYGHSDIQFQGGEVKITEIGTVEDTPVEEVRQILGGLGSRRRGLARPSTNDHTDRQKVKGIKRTTTTGKPNLKDDYDYYYDY